MEPVRSSSDRLHVAIVAASLRILGGQAVQAQQLLDVWREDPAVRAWLVPINPLPPAPFHHLLGVKYVRTLVTQLWYWPLLVREIRRADVVHVFSASYASFLLSPLPAIVVARLLGKPVVLNYHSGEAPDHLARSRIARTVLRRLVDLNVVPSRFLRDVLAAFRIPARVVANCVDLDRFAWRDRPAPGPRLLSTRMFEPMYNVGCTVRAFARVQQQYPDASLMLVGDGSQGPTLRGLVAELALRNVTFAGRVPPHEIHRYYAEADIYVQTPSIDNMPLSVLEAFASGLPVVSTDVGGVPAILTSGVHGLLAADNDDRAIAGRVCELLTDPPRARAMAEAARRTCDAYTWQAVRDAWLSCYRDAAAARNHAPIPIEAA